MIYSLLSAFLPVACLGVGAQARFDALDELTRGKTSARFSVLAPLSLWSSLSAVRTSAGLVAEHRLPWETSLLQTGFDFEWTRNSDALAVQNGLGGHVDVAPYYIWGGFALGALVEAQQTWASHISHHEKARASFDDIHGDGMRGSPRDGWLGPSAWLWRAGVASFWSLSETWQLGGDVGTWRFAFREPLTTYPDVGILPFQARVWVRWGVREF